MIRPTCLCASRARFDHNSIKHLSEKNTKYIFLNGFLYKNFPIYFLYIPYIGVFAEIGGLKLSFPGSCSILFIFSRKTQNISIIWHFLYKQVNFKNPFEMEALLASGFVNIFMMLLISCYLIIFVTSFN